MFDLLEARAGMDLTAGLDAAIGRCRSGRLRGCRCGIGYRQELGGGRTPVHRRKARPNSLSSPPLRVAGRMCPRPPQAMVPWQVALLTAAFARRMRLARQAHACATMRTRSLRVAPDAVRRTSRCRYWYDGVDPVGRFGRIAVQGDAQCRRISIVSRKDRRTSTYDDSPASREVGPANNLRPL